MKSKRVWLDKDSSDSDSYVRVSLDKSGNWLSIKLADCNRTIEWSFGVVGSKKAKAKITVLKKIVDEVYHHLYGGKPKKKKSK